MYARQLLEYGESKEGYWTADKFINQINSAIKLLNLNILKVKGGGWCGYLTTVVVMLQWQTIR